MLYLALGLSIAWLLLANGFARWSSYPIVLNVGLGAVGFVLPTFVCMILPAFQILSGFIAVSAFLLFIPRHGRRVFHIVTLAGAVSIWGYAFVNAVLITRELEEHFKFQNLDDGTMKPPTPANSFPTKSLDQMETVLDGQEKGFETHWQREKLIAFHQDRKNAFVNSFGNGVGRMSDMRLRPSQTVIVSVPQPGSNPDESFLTADVPQDEESLAGLHQAGVVDFANPSSFGLVEDRKKVSGFVPHHLTGVPKPVVRWEVRTLELVGLLRHPEPVVYVSPNLPRMDELKGAPTRPLSDFEREGLDKLQKGEDLFLRSDGHRLLMLGSIRNAKQCLVCHEGRRGDLLGAFSYSLGKRK